jgi:hypothetical protein
LDARAFYGLLDDFAVGFGGEGTGATAAAGTGCSADSVEIDLMGLGCFVVDDCVDAFDVETSRCEIGCEEEGDFAVSECLNTCDTL